MNELTREKERISYVLITPARNEERSIDDTIRSMISQTCLPKKWIIVSDGSTDRTDDIVKQYLPEYPWMDLIRMPEHGDRHFAAKVGCFDAGYERVKELPYEVIGNLDGDISFDRDYLEFLIDKFSDDPDLGVAGTPFVENGKHYDYRFTNIEHVSGACQLFRRSCFEEIGGYRPIRAWRHRLGCRYHCEDEGMEDKDFRGQGMHPPSQDGDRQYGAPQDVVEAGQQGLLPG